MMGTIDTSVIENLARADADDYICGYKDSLDNKKQHIISERKREI